VNQKHIDALIKNYEKFEEFFDEKYGDGAAEAAWEKYGD